MGKCGYGGGCDCHGVKTLKEEELRPALSWIDTLLMIQELKKENERLKECFEKIRFGTGLNYVDIFNICDEALKENKKIEETLKKYG